jgi:hypothetical protein
MPNFSLKVWRNRTIWKPRRRWEVNNKANLQKGGCEGVEGINLFRDRVQ